MLFAILGAVTGVALGCAIVAGVDSWLDGNKRKEKA